METKLIRINKYSKYHPLPKKEKQRDFEENIYNKCKILTKSGVFVQSQGEKKIADFLFDHGIEFEYDKRINFGEEDYPDKPFWARPDFRIKNTNILIEYWGMKYDRADNPTYDEKAERKIALYYQEEMILIEVFAEQLEILDSYLSKELERVGVM